MKPALRTLALATALAMLAGCASQPPANNLVEINLVALNDLHGHLEAGKFTYKGGLFGRQTMLKAGGIDTIAAALQAWRKEDRELLLVGAGDMVGASPAISSMWADEPTIGALNMLGLKATAVGNHEFDAGRIELLRQQKGGCNSPRPDKACKFSATYEGAKFNYLAANVIDLVTKKPILPAYEIVEAHGVKVGLIGAVLKDTPSVVLASGIAGLAFEDEAQSINRVLPELKAQGVGVFVVLMHEGGRTESAFDKQDCSDLKGAIVDVVKRLDPAIRLVVSGHSHKGYLCRVDGKLVTQAEMGGHMLSRIKLTVDKAANTVRSVSARNVVMQPNWYRPVPEVDAYLKKVKLRSEQELARPVARLGAATISRERHGGDESALGNLVADATLLSGRPFGAQIAFMNNGGVRANLESNAGGFATVGHAQAVLPFGNTLTVMNMTGAQIKTLLEQQWVDDKVASRGLLQLSEGFTYQWDPQQPEGSRVVPGSVMLHGVPLEDGASYRVAANAFIAAGGDAFPEFAKGTNRVITAVRDIDSLTAYLIKCEQDRKPAGSVTAQEPRIQRLK
ncbi:bifunctional metallophosphatase/5'-nucleotidase [Massilia sp. MB5]|uniref:bifunctional metallophosphatase/5'-nucleotidase n=1 Tax=Massilia sp. MB5 TaxID=2919578 RepID=UPI001F0FEFC4|nr:bifunctional metallophosphatase/5'-nucleotidase [Massilia sp. MB5]UMR32831.1 bifunctional metallophosphatase/5'-nucleotidase [Massilia sp. MB5]